MFISCILGPAYPNNAMQTLTSPARPPAQLQLSPPASRRCLLPLKIPLLPSPAGQRRRALARQRSPLPRGCTRSCLTGYCWQLRRIWAAAQPTLTFPGLIVIAIPCPDATQTTAEVSIACMATAWGVC